MKMLTKQGREKQPKKAEVVTEEMESELYRMGILGDQCPETLLRTVYFLVGKFFALRSREEHRALSWGVGAQIQHIGMGKNEKIVYLERNSKTYKGGMKNYKNQPELVKFMQLVANFVL